MTCNSRIATFSRQRCSCNVPWRQPEFRIVRSFDDCLQQMKTGDFQQGDCRAFDRFRGSLLNAESPDCNRLLLMRLDQ